ncbi:MAG TPA: Ig-like domain-containing protein [Chthoniobacterales bacterium]|nr:Ig-like domain-containing protein [Chthoniobacterales bacterium]
MKRSFWKIWICSLFSLGALIYWAHAKSGGAIDAPEQSQSVPTFAGNPQHTSIYQPAAQNLNRIIWSTDIDFHNSFTGAHYSPPLITAANTVLVPIKTATDGFQITAFTSSGASIYTVTTDYVLPTHGWIPTYNPVVTTGSFGTRLYYAGRGGTIYHIDNPDSAAHGPAVQEVFYTTLANYQANAAAYNAAIFVNTPITADSSGNIFFGFRVQGTAPAPISSTQSGFARIDPNGNGTYVLTGATINNSAFNRDNHNSAPALSNDETTLYVVVKQSSTGAGYLVGLNSTTLATKYQVHLRDPRDGGEAGITDDSTSSATVGPDGDVFFGLFGTPGDGSRGFLLHFTGDLATEKPPGAFGWDYTCAIVPSSMVPSYQGTSSYLIFAKYNNYAFDDGDGVNRIALLDPNDTQLDFHPSAFGLVEMREVLTVTGPTPDPGALSTQFPYAVREWCINTAAVNPATNSIFTPSEDGYIYRWDLATNSLSQGLKLTQGIGEPYVPTVIGPGGIIYTLNGGTMFALGNVNGVGVVVTSSMPDVRTVVVGQSLTFTATVTNTGTPGPTPTGSVTFQDLTYQGTTAVTTTLGTVSLSGGQAAITTSSLTAGSGFLGNHLITATYNGDANFSSGSARLVQKVHPSASATSLTSSPNPSNAGQSVTFTATVTPVPSGSTARTGMVTFQEGNTVLAQVPLNASGTCSFSTSSLSPGSHSVTATYQSDTFFALSTGSTVQQVGPGSSATPTPTATATPVPTTTPQPSTTPTPTPSGTPGPASQAVNLSTRMRVLTGNNVGIGGFIITGTGTKNVLIRAVGPSLSQFGVPDPLADPVLELHGPGAFVTVNNDNWMDDPVQRALIEATGLQPTNNVESAIYATLDPGEYTAIISGKNNTTGVGLIEVYDVAAGDPSMLGNISTRAFVSTGSDIVIAGFILGGTNTGPDRVVIRGLGPSLTGSGISDPLANPTLELRDSNGALLLANNDWQDNAGQAAELIAAGLAPTNNLESGIAATLSPGLYTALLSGVSNGTGVGVVEIYHRGQ